MDGLLVVDKPSGLTSHDVVARARRLLRERRIGHTGTLDPLATGVLPLVVGRATRLARFLTASDKSYDATLRLGVTTTTGDADGTPIGPVFEGAWPTHAAIEDALARFRGRSLQRPPLVSAKKVDGQRSYVRARQDVHAEPPPPVLVTAHAIELASVEGAIVRLRVRVSAGYYVRSLVHDLGVALGTGAHLTALRRTASGRLTLAEAWPLASPDDDGAGAQAMAHVRPMQDILTDWPTVRLSAQGLAHVRCGRTVGPDDAEAWATWEPDPDAVAGPDASPPAPTEALRAALPRVRLLAPDGELVALGTPTAAGGLLHPSVVLV